MLCMGYGLSQPQHERTVWIHECGNVEQGAASYSAHQQG
jgi:hypothetical protein